MRAHVSRMCVSCVSITLRNTCKGNDQQCLKTRGTVEYSHPYKRASIDSLTLQKLAPCNVFSSLVCPLL